MGASLTDLYRWIEDAGWRMVGEPRDAFFESRLFHDTAYHRTAEGAKQRTDRSIERLREERLL